MTSPATSSRRTRIVAVLAAAVMVFVTLPAAPAHAAGGLCYVATGKPYVPPSGGGGLTGPGMSPQGPVVACDQLTAYTDPGTLFGGAGDKVTDRYGNSVDDYYFDDGYRDLTDVIKHPTVKLSTWVANIAFSLDQLFVWVSCWLVNVSLNFGVSDALLGPVAQVANGYQTHVVDRFGLVNLALMICVFCFGLSALRGRVGKGAGEILLSFCIAAVGGIILAAPADTVLGEHGLLGQTRDFGVGIAALPLSDPDGTVCPPGSNIFCAPGDNPTPADVAKPFQYAMIDTFIRKPHEQMAYGVIFDNPGAEHPCLATYNKIIATDRDSTDDSVMYEEMAKCDPRLAKQLRQDTGTRIVTSILVALGALVMLAYILVGVVLPILGGQIALAALAILVVLAIPVSLTGGPGRRALWLWVGATASVLAAMVTSFASLAFFLVAVNALVSVGGNGFLLRMLLVDIAAIVLLSVHRRLLHSTRYQVRHAARRLDRAKIGGSGMRGMGMGGRAWSVRGVWRDVQATNAEAGRLYERVASVFRRGDDEADEGDGAHRRDERPAPPAVCPNCHGDGTVPVWSDALDDWDDQTCPRCGGSGNP
jgi:hypothetical protein